MTACETPAASAPTPEAPPAFLAYSNFGIGAVERYGTGNTGERFIVMIPLMLEYPRAAGDALLRSLNELHRAGIDAATAERGALTDDAPAVRAAKSQKAKLNAALADYQRELADAQRDHADARQAVQTALRRGDDPTPHEQRESAAGERIKAIQRRLDGTTAALGAEHAVLTRAIDDARREAGKQLLARYKAEFDALAGPLAEALYAALPDLLRLRAALDTLRD